MESLPQIPEFNNNAGNLHPWNNKSCSGEPIREKKCCWYRLPASVVELWSINSSGTVRP